LFGFYLGRLDRDTVLHAMILFAMVITLNVSVNSNSNSLFVVLVSNNFMGT